MPFDWEYRQSKDLDHLLWLNEQEAWRHSAELVRARLLDFLRHECDARVLCEAVALMGTARALRKQAEAERAKSPQ